jgi:His/Glu/Gln/Arg/opine family amino acid ABC transporter permease subunit
MEGTWMTIKLSAMSLLVAVLLGLLGASAKLSKSNCCLPAQLYTTLIRGVPDLVLMLLIFYSLQTWLTVTDYMEWEYIEIDPFSAGVITLGFIYGAYFTETFRGAILAVPRGQVKPPPPTASNAASVSHRGVPADDALRPAGHRQQLDGHAQGHRAGVDHRPGGSGQGRAGRR